MKVRTNAQLALELAVGSWNAWAMSPPEDVPDEPDVTELADEYFEWLERHSDS